MTERSSASPIVETTVGCVRGYISAGGLMAFKGLPYGASTSEERRFLPPRPAASWRGVRDATEYGPRCPQMPSGYADDAVGSGEDCLVVNVWTPGADGARRPVMVWLHGGWYSLGSGSFPIWEGSKLAERGDVVVVSVNHRLDVFGHLYLGRILGDDYAASGNVGLLDLVEALRWVRDNIASFGGDPGNVTLFGVSGGGSKATHLMAMAEVRGLFHKALVASGSDLWRNTALDEADFAARALIDELGGGSSRSTRNKLLSVSSEELVEASRTANAKNGFLPAGVVRGYLNGGLLSPVVDGITLPEPPQIAIAGGAAAEVSLLVGSRLHDHFTPGRPDKVFPGAAESDPDAQLAAKPWAARYGWLADAEVSSILQPYYGEHTDRVLDAYRSSRPGASASELLATVVTDSDFRIPAIRLAEAKIAGGGRPAYMYFYATEDANLDASQLAFGNVDVRPGAASNARSFMGQIQASGSTSRVSATRATGRFPSGPRMRSTTARPCSTTSNAGSSTTRGAKRAWRGTASDDASHPELHRKVSERARGCPSSVRTAAVGRRSPRVGLLRLANPAPSVVDRMNNPARG